LEVRLKTERDIAAPPNGSYLMDKLSEDQSVIRVPDEKKKQLEKIATGKGNKPVSRSAEVKEYYFRAFLSAGGLKRLTDLIQQRKLGKTKESKQKAAEADRRFLEFCYRVLPGLFPKKTELDIERRSVVFVFQGGVSEKFEADVPVGEPVIDAEVEDK
jgi:hypothetical protein